MESSLEVNSNSSPSESSDYSSPYGNRPLTVLEHLIISGFWFATNFQWGAILAILIPEDMRRLAGSNLSTLTGIVIGLGALPALIVPLISGPVSDRCTSKAGRRKPYIAVGAIINFIGLLFMAVAATSIKSVYAYLVGYAVVQIGNNIASGAYMGVIPDVVPKSEHGKASGFMALMSQLGTLFGMVTIGIVIRPHLEVARYAVIGVVLLLFAGISYFCIRETPITTKPPFDFANYVRSLWISPKKYPNFAWVWITRFLVMLGFYAILGYVSLYLVDIVGVSPDDVGGVVPKVFGLILVVSSITGIYGGVLSDRIGKKRVVYISNAIISIVTPFFVLCNGIPLVLAVAAIFGLGYGAYISVDYALGTDVLPDKEKAGKDMAVWHIAMTLPQTIAAPIAGVLLAWPGSKITPNPHGEPIVHYFPLGYTFIFVFCAICFGLGAILLRNVKGVS
ncbi:MAG: MFS transporter [Armatimonadetes bacterium]|nr:MFS transporter [Armatimonadota bacterium]MBS1728145.1 MFS transporter [Armatimonadota bacterium]